MFKGIAPPSQFPATVASGAPPRPNHACCEEGVHVCFETLWRRGGGVCNVRNIFFLKKVLSAHYVPTTSPLHPRGSPTKGTNQSGPKKGRKCYITPAFSGDPQTNGDKIRNGCLNPAYWGAHKWAEMLRHPCFLGDPQQRGQNQSTKKTKKNKNKQFPMVSLILPMVL